MAVAAWMSRRKTRWESILEQRLRELNGVWGREEG
jgi:hypothetical protein